MSGSIRRSILHLLALLLASHAALAGDFFEVDGSALRGYDPVSYFDDGKPTRGSPEFTYVYKGSRFTFATAENQRKFAASPEKYAPQYGGFCAYGTSNGYKVSTQPDAFKIVDGKLYLNYNRQVQEIWSKDVPANIARANEKWPEVSKMALKQ
jgi:YHS domain-containing protein